MAIQEIIVYKIERTNVASTATAVNVTRAYLDSKTVVGTLQLSAFDSRVGTSPSFGMCADKSGNIYISDTAANMIYKMTEGGQINHLAGVGGASGNNSALQNVTASLAKFNAPKGIICSNSGNIYVADSGNNQIRKITDGYVSVFAGNGATTAGLVDASLNPLQAQFSAPVDVAVDNTGNVFVADSANYAIRRITGGRVLNICGGTSGNLQNAKASNIAGVNNFFAGMTSVAVDANGNVFVADSTNLNIKKITPNGWVYLFSGSGASGKSLGTGTKPAYTCSYQNIKQIRFARDGYMYVLDGGAGSPATSRLVKLTPNGVPSNMIEFVQAGTDAAAGVAAFAISPANKLFVAVVHT